MAIDPCNICGSTVRIVKRPGPRRIGEVTAPMEDVRVCTNRECPSNTGERAIGETV